MADDVLYALEDGGVAVLTLNRPERLNAWNGDIERQLFDYLDQCTEDPDVKVIVITGAGRGFCAGADMDVLQGIGDRGGQDRNAGPRRRTYHMLDVPKPVIAAINGACAGIGMVQALMTDIRFAAKGAKFTTAFVRRGLIAEHGMSWVLPKLIGPARALDVLLSGRIFLAEEAAEMGIVNAVVEPGELMAYTLNYARDMAVNCSPSSLAAIKREVWGQLVGLSVEEATAQSDGDMAHSLAGADFKEGVSSFLEKRPPNFAPLQRGWATGD
jgi:enoyl-CoA hydratase/carnithine racemase